MDQPAAISLGNIVRSAIWYMPEGSELTLMLYTRRQIIPDDLELELVQYARRQLTTRRFELILVLYTKRSTDSIYKTTVFYQTTPNKNWFTIPSDNYLPDDRNCVSI